MTLCPCGSKKSYDLCCGPFLEKKQIPTTPEELMRSRYTAFVKGDVDYIFDTMRGKAREGFSKEETRRWAQSVKWLNLTILNAPSVKQGEITGWVELIASFKENDIPSQIHEMSQFHLIDGRWYYVSGQYPDKRPQSGRNAPCSCGSGKKFKSCCGK